MIIAYRSEARRLEATSRLRDSLPRGTPIYARVVSGQGLGRAELLEAGATEVVSERIEAALRFGELLGACGNGDGSADTARFRRVLAAQEPGSIRMLPPPEEGGAVPGLSELIVYNLSEELGCSRKELVKLHEVFTSLPNSDGDEEVGMNELRDVLLRLDDFPIGDAELERWMEFADKDGGGKISFFEFARAYFSSVRREGEPSRN